MRPWWTISQPSWIPSFRGVRRVLVRWQVRTITIIDIRCNPSMNRLGFRGCRDRRPSGQIPRVAIKDAVPSGALSVPDRKTREWMGCNQTETLVLDGGPHGLNTWCSCARLPLCLTASGPAPS